MQGKRERTGKERRGKCRRRNREESERMNPALRYFDCQDCFHLRLIQSMKINRLNSSPKKKRNAQKKMLGVFHKPTITIDISSWVSFKDRTQVYWQYF